MKKCILLLMLLFIILSSGCDCSRYKRPVKPYVGEDISQIQLINIVSNQLHCKKVIAGSVSYYLPSLKWVNNTVYPDLCKFLSSEHIIYQKQFDCKDYSRSFKTIAQIEYVHTIKKEKVNGLAIAELWYFRDGNPNNGHAINLILTSDNKIVFYEPQSGYVIHLSKTELQHIYTVIF